MKSVEVILICKKERESLLQETNQIKSNITIFTLTFSMQWYFHINCINSLPVSIMVKYTVHVYVSKCTPNYNSYMPLNLPYCNWFHFTIRGFVLKDVSLINFNATHGL